MVIPNGGALNRNMVPLTPSGLMSLGPFGGFFVFFSVEKIGQQQKNKQGFFYQRCFFLEVKFCIDFCLLATHFVVGFYLFFFRTKRGGNPMGRLSGILLEPHHTSR